MIPNDASEVTANILVDDSSEEWCQCRSSAPVLSLTAADQCQVTTNMLPDDGSEVILVGHSGEELDQRRSSSPCS